MKLSEITAKTDRELQQMIEDSRLQIAELYIDYRTKQVKNVKTLSSAKRDLARALTLQRERAIAEQEKNHE